MGILLGLFRALRFFAVAAPLRSAARVESPASAGKRGSRLARCCTLIEACEICVALLFAIVVIWSLT